MQRVRICQIELSPAAVNSLILNCELNANTELNDLIVLLKAYRNCVSEVVLVMEAFNATSYYKVSGRILTNDELEVDINDHES